MYGWHSQLANFTPQSQSASLEMIVDYYNATGRPGILELEGVFFQDIKVAHPNLRGLMLKPTAVQDWQELLPTLRPLVQKQIVVGFMLGDELV